MIKVVLVLILLMGSGGYGAYAWITKLQSDNKVLQVNQSKLEGAVAEQEVAIKQQATDAAKIQSANSELREQIVQNHKKHL